jgi:hypothetical protein
LWYTRVPAGRAKSVLRTSCRDVSRVRRKRLWSFVTLLSLPITASASGAAFSGVFRAGAVASISTIIE